MNEQRREHVGRVVRKEIRIEATPQEVWDAWARPERIARWFVDRAEGDMARDREVVWCFDTFDYRLPVQVYEALPGRRLLFGVEAPDRPPALQEVVVVQEGGATRLRIANSGFGEGAQWDDELEGVDSGWELALATLEHALEEQPGRERLHRIALRPATFEYGTVQRLFTTGAGLERWLTAGGDHGGAPLEAGDPVRWELADLGPLEGRVLVRTPRELMVTWPARRGLLTLKAFAMGPTRAVALDWQSWAGEEGELPEGWLEARVAALADALPGR